MKNNHILLLSFFIFLLGCNEPKKKEKIIKKTREVSTNKCLPHLNDNPKLKDEKILIYEEGNDSLVISKDELNKIEILFPVFKAEYPSRPNESYAGKIWENYISQDGKEQSITFGSEAGRDNFCLLYAYYLKQKNGEKKFKSEREILIQLYRAINGLYGGLNYGGTYYGHQHKRLNAAVEYSIYELAVGKEYYEKKYNFQKQKDLYIKTVIQYVADEESQNVYYQEDLMNDKKRANERVKQLQDKINILQKLITNYFYLNQVQNFEITYYK